MSRHFHLFPLFFQRSLAGALRRHPWRRGAVLHLQLDRQELPSVRAWIRGEIQRHREEIRLSEGSRDYDVVRKKIKCVKPFEALTRCVFRSAQICCTGNGSFMALGILTFCFLTKNEASQKLAHDYFHTASILGISLSNYCKSIALEYQFFP